MDCQSSSSTLFSSPSPPILRISNLHFRVNAPNVAFVSHHHHIMLTARRCLLPPSVSRWCHSDTHFIQSLLLPLTPCTTSSVDTHNRLLNVHDYLKSSISMDGKTMTAPKQHHQSGSNIATFELAADIQTERWIIYDDEIVMKRKECSACWGP